MSWQSKELLAKTVWIFSPQGWKVYEGLRPAGVGYAGGGGRAGSYSIYADGVWIVTKEGESIRASTYYIEDW